MAANILAGPLLDENVDKCIICLENLSNEQESKGICTDAI